MEDLFGIIIFLVFALVSVASKVLKRPEERTPAPRYPGPVAGPGVPGFPRPEWPGGPSPAQAPRQASVQPVMGEGTPGGEGVGSGMEGPDSPGAYAEAERFNKESDRRLGELTQTAQPEHSAERAGLDLAGAFADRPAMARAIVLAEVFGKPKGKRRR